MYNKRMAILSLMVAFILSISAGGSVLALDDDDDETIEVGVYWVMDYVEINQTQYWIDLWDDEDDATGFANTLEDEGWDVEFNEGDDDGITQSDLEGDSGAETVDICYFAGHGTPGHLILKDDCPPYQVDRVYYGDCTWGDGDLEWIMMHSCSTLYYDDDASGQKTNGMFANALDGIRIICGAHTVMYTDTEAGSNVANYLVDDDGGGADEAYMVVDSWFLGMDQTHGSSITLRALGETYGILDNDYIWGQGSGPNSYPFTVDNYYYSFTYNCED